MIMPIHPLTLLAVPTNLPPELVHKIFLHAAQSSRSSCRTLSVVSTWTRRIALPHLYTTISITSHIIIVQFLSCVTNPPVLPPNPTFSPLDLVQNLWATAISDRFGTLFRRCPNISHIALHASNLPWLIYADDYWEDHTTTDAIRGPDLDILMLQNFCAPSSDWSLDNYFWLRVFGRITHLRLEDPLQFRTQLRMQNMSRLTHLAVPCGDPDVQDLACILPAVRDTSIKMFVLIVSIEYLTQDQCRAVEDWVRMTRMTRERIYVVRPLYDQLKDEWEAEVRGGATIWERAFEYTQLVMSRV